MLTKEQKEWRKQLKKNCPQMYESSKKKEERRARVIALLKSPLYAEAREENSHDGMALMDALAQSHGYPTE